MIFLYIFLIILLIFLFSIACIKFLEDTNPYIIINYWNSYIHTHRNKQNKKCTKELILKPNDEYGKIPKSMEYAEKSHLKSARKLNKLILANHDKILEEVNCLLQSGYEGLQMNKIDSTQGSAFRKNNGWKTLWVKFINNYSGISDHLPTLKKIVKEMKDDVYLLHISIFEPHTHIPKHRGISKGVMRYHYGLDIPKGDLGMTINNEEFKWENKKGYIFDDTLMHDSWNHTSEKRMIIFADLPREKLGIYTKLNKYVHTCIQNTKHIKAIQEKLKEQNVKID